MKSSFDGSCAFDGSSCGNTLKPSMASLGGCALEDEIESPSSAFEEEEAEYHRLLIISGCALEDDEVASKPSSALEYHRLSPRRRKGSAEKRRSAKRVVILYIREEEGSKSGFLLWITVSGVVRKLEILE